MEPNNLSSFLELVDQGFNVVPLSETLQLDRETPVSLYQRFGSRAIFLLESAALGEATGRYSFIGLDRRWRVTTNDGATVVEGTEIDDAHAGVQQFGCELRGNFVRGGKKYGAGFTRNNAVQRKFVQRSLAPTS